MQNTSFEFATSERFADIQLLRYRLKGFEELSLQQKLYIYYLSQAALAGRDITFDQKGKYNLVIRQLLEAITISHPTDDHSCQQELSEMPLFQNTSEYQQSQWQEMKLYLKRVWFSSGIYHHYGQEKFQPGFSREWFMAEVKKLGEKANEILGNFTLNEVSEVMFNPTVMPKCVCKDDGVDVLQASACNYYDGVTQQEAENFYNTQLKKHPLNSRLTKDGEEVWRIDGHYDKPLRRIVYWLGKAREVAENEQQQHCINLLTEYYHTGDPDTFDRFSIEWLKEQEGRVDFINGFIEVYGDPLGYKGSWEGFVSYKDIEATRRTRLISDNAQWFEDNSPTDPRFHKKKVKGVVANVVCAAMLGGDEYPASAIGINLPNAEWIREQYGSKSVTICNLTEAYNEAARGNGMRQEFVIDQETINLIDKYGNACDDLHTDLHECLGHGSGQLMPGICGNELKNYGNTIEEARADLFGLYYIADPKLVELGLLPDKEAYKSQYYTYMLNGLLTQLTRIKLGCQIEEAHMRNRALIARYALKPECCELTTRNGKTYLRINSYEALRQRFAELLCEVQRIKSEGDYEAARMLVEEYAVKIDPQLHAEVLERYDTLRIAPYKGFINPRMELINDALGCPIDVTLDYTESYSAQMLRYSRESSET